ncbi:hypothetical protein BpHYR1_008552 [Brachionus plicatilis]|uniref:Uncharacterized protein n=1 Tax=Brachionus plicatilis TaxID=10195 RepID=A0A3M7PDA8_BRAPC|nr:hypothetical protein BpHYR1_008552 [Brachionus plicatilis]
MSHQFFAFKQCSSQNLIQFRFSNPFYWLKLLHEKMRYNHNFIHPFVKQRFEDIYTLGHNITPLDFLGLPRPRTPVSLVKTFDSLTSSCSEDLASTSICSDVTDFITNKTKISIKTEKKSLFDLSNIFYSFAKSATMAILGVEASIVYLQYSY